METLGAVIKWLKKIKTRTSILQLRKELAWLNSNTFPWMEVSSHFSGVGFNHRWRLWGELTSGITLMFPFLKNAFNLLMFSFVSKCIHKRKKHTEYCRGYIECILNINIQKIWRNSLQAFLPYPNEKLHSHKYHKFNSTINFANIVTCSNCS